MKFEIKSTWYFWATSGIVLLSLFLVFKSSTRQSHTIDEPNHYFCGLEWWQKGSYEAWPENPELSRAVTGLGPYLAGARQHHFIPQDDNVGSFDFFLNSYNFDYFTQPGLKDQLLSIRISVMVMFLLSILIIWRWTYELGGSTASFLAVGMYATVPTILAHSGLGTTDITFVACFILLIWRFISWVKKPTKLNGVFFGAGLAAGMLAKFSVLPFFLASMLIVFPLYILFNLKGDRTKIWKWIRNSIASGLLATAVMIVLMWAFHRFSTGPVGDEPIIQIGISELKFSPIWKEIILPFPEWFAGLLVLLDHNKDGHMAYLFGNLSTSGYWYFYPVSFLFKTPWPFLLFTILGSIGVFYKSKGSNWEILAVLLIPLAILISTIPSHINLGLRHLLVLFPLLAIAGAVGVVRLFDYWTSLHYKLRVWLPVFIVCWQLTIALIAYPFYLSYFNGFAGKEPGKILLDSDLDWGQGLFELVDFCKENKVDTLHAALFTVGPHCLYDLPNLKILPPDSVVQGWVAISETMYQGAMKPVILPGEEACDFLVFDFGPEGKAYPGYKWLDSYPLRETVGKSIRLYYVE